LISSLIPIDGTKRYPDEAITTGRGGKGPGGNSKKTAFLWSAASYDLLTWSKGTVTRVAGRGRLPPKVLEQLLEQYIQQCMSCSSHHAQLLQQPCSPQLRGATGGPRGSRVFHGVPATAANWRLAKRFPKFRRLVEPQRRRPVEKPPVTGSTTFFACLACRRLHVPS
jgi:hypothetical protein